MNVKSYIKILFLLSLLVATSCIELVKDGIEIEYPESNATLTVEAIASEKASIGETISYRIQALSSVDIKSCIVQTSNPGRNGSGFNVKGIDFDDPFADHNFGTIKKGIKSFTVRYDYIIPEGVNKSRLSFTIVDEIGKVTTDKTLSVVPGIQLFEDQKLYAKNNTFNDAFASINGVVYPDIKTNFSILSETALNVQERIDIIFFYDAVKKRTVLAGTASNEIDLELQVENETRFKKLVGQKDINLKEVSAEFLSNVTNDEELLAEGKVQVSGLMVGDVLAFITDLNAVHSLKTGLIKVTGLHPASVDHYEGLVYVLEFDIVVQK